LKYLESTIKSLETRSPRILAELHPLLRAKVVKVLELMNGTVTPYCGYRGQKEQEQAFRAKASNAHWLESPHNYTPALACDVVLNPANLDCGGNPADYDYPWLWNDKDADCLKVWQRLDTVAEGLGLERVDLRPGVRDFPHLQLPHWRTLIRSEA
jgi:hypothetical protein